MPSVIPCETDLVIEHSSSSCTSLVRTRWTIYVFRIVVERQSPDCLIRSNLSERGARLD